jgi:hypothetical protein
MSERIPHPASSHDRSQKGRFPTLAEKQMIFVEDHCRCALVRQRRPIRHWQFCRSSSTVMGMGQSQLRYGERDKPNYRHVPYLCHQLIVIPAASPNRNRKERPSVLESHFHACLRNSVVSMNRTGIWSRPARRYAAKRLLSTDHIFPVRESFQTRIAGRSSIFPFFKPTALLITPCPSECHALPPFCVHRITLGSRNCVHGAPLWTNTPLAATW